MSYIWERENRGNTLYEMALYEATVRTYPLTDAGKAKAAEIAKQLGDSAKILGPSDNAPNGLVLFPNADNEEMSGRINELIKAGVIDGSRGTAKATPGNTRPAEKKPAENDAFSKKLTPEVKSALEKIVANIKAGHTLLGKNPENEDEVQKIARFKSILDGKDEQNRQALILKLVDLIEDSGIAMKGENLYSKQKEKTRVNGNIEMPAMFDVEPDDTMWDDIVVTEFGIPMVNMSHPVVKKIIASDEPEEDCPIELKQFKEAVYGDERLTAIFGKGGFSRVILGKLSNLLTLGITAATLDEGKRADRIIKELKEKGGRIGHRNLLLVNYSDVIDADPDDDNATVPAKAYSRASKKFLGDLEVPVAALNQFYAAVDPIKSGKIYIEMLGNEGSGIDMGKAMGEAAGVSGDALVEGPISAVTKGVSALSHKVAGKSDPGKMAKKTEGNSEFEKMKEQYVAFLKKEGHPPAYVLKPRTENKEVDVISKAETGRVQASGVVHMVTMRIGEHEAAAFMKPEDIKLYFSV